MKKPLFIAFLFTISFAHAQSVVIAADKMNVFYLGVDNPVAIAVEGISDDKLTVSIDNGTIKRTGRGEYTARLDSTGIAHITVEWDGKKRLMPFRVKPIPDPTIKGLRNPTHGIPKPEFRGLFAVVENFDIDARCSVKSYTFILVPTKGETKKIEVTGSASDEVITLGNNLESGDKVIISNIFVFCPGDKTARVMKDTLTFVKN